MLLLCMSGLMRMKAVASGGAVDRRGWWRVVVLHAINPHRAAPNGWMLWSDVCGVVNPFAQVLAVGGDDCNEL